MQHLASYFHYKNVIFCREHDKGPDDFSVVLHKLLDSDMQFTVSLLGSRTTDIPGVDYVCDICDFL